MISAGYASALSNLAHVGIRAGDGSFPIDVKRVTDPKDCIIAISQRAVAALLVA